MPVSAVSTGASAQTIYPYMINGVLVFSAAEAAAARNFTTSPTTTAPVQAATRAATSQPPVQAALQTYGSQGATASSQTGQRGSVLDIFA